MMAAREPEANDPGLSIDCNSLLRTRGLREEAIDRLGRLVGLFLGSPINVIGTRCPTDIERQHILDSLSLLELPQLQQPGASIVDVGAGGGLPSLVLAVALPHCKITAVESIAKKCNFIQSAAEALGLRNVTVVCERAEVYGHGQSRERFDVAVTRAVGPLSLVAELSVPLLAVGGLFVAMKGRIEADEWATGVKALGILGVEAIQQTDVVPFPGAQNRCLVVGRKTRATPDRLPRKGAALVKRPLGRGASGVRSA